MLNSNQPIKVPDHQKLTNQSILNGALRNSNRKQKQLKIEIVKNSFNKSKKSFDKTRNVLIEKKERCGRSKIYFYQISLYSALFIQKCKRKAKLLMSISDFRKKENCSKSVTKKLNWNKILVSECIFKLVCYCENCRRSEICCA